MENKELGLPDWPKERDALNAEDLALLVAADAMRVDADKWRMLNETEFDDRTNDQHHIQALAIGNVLSAHLAVTALLALRALDPSMADAVARNHWNAAEQAGAVEDLWHHLAHAGIDVKALRS